ncbi:hypothetical protein EJ08DRAFT_53200 [Tothia fuscella]|uniref:T6SS Phospholipase effector Tle1-like catalytic domain-containing protein n=1 Tax=Tothia fuscella TaxID=1048955 RepID=A0A9P4TSW2_9PEZI|nr:hypothetical protein EJ08DRAFT_53200 [Tothia fuscella]
MSSRISQGHGDRDDSIFIRPAPPPPLGYSPRGSRDEIVVVRHERKPSHSPEPSHRGESSIIVRHEHGERPPRSPQPPASIPGALTIRDAKPKPGGRAPYKRLIVCADGTWLNSDDGMQIGELPNPSNVTRINRAIKSESSDGIPQICYYQYGLGTQGGIVDRVVMGSVGEGLSDLVREGYSFLSNNYAPGDEIFLYGFSRGAFTVRSIAGLMDCVGLLTKRGLPYLTDIFKDVQHRRDRYYRSKHRDRPFPNKPSANDPRYREELVRRGMTDLDVCVKVIGVWDTVGSLGLPRINVLTRVGLQSDQSRAMSFYDTKLSGCVENAFQALALDERRTAFAPAVWEKPAGCQTRLRQVWFPGVHSNVGGGYDDQELANITLAWMMAQSSPFLDFFPNYIMNQAKENDEYYHSKHKKLRPWSFGKLVNSMTGIYGIGGGTTRTPGTYYATDPNDGNTTDRPLRDTQEYIHPSVRTRIRLRGPGVEDKGKYDPEALDEWRLVVEYPEGQNEKPDIYWKARFSDRNVSTRVLPESPLWDLERRLLGLDEDTEEYVLWPPATKERRPD